MKWKEVFVLKQKITAFNPLWESIKWFILKIKHMKTLNSFVVVLAALSLIACKNPKSKKAEQDTVMLEKTEKVSLKNNSDKRFESALQAIKGKEYKVAGDRLMEGVDELKAEAHEFEGSRMGDLEPQLRELTSYANTLKKGTSVDSRSLKELIANAELKVGHNYLLNDDVYVISRPERVEDAHLVAKLHSTMNKLDKSSKSLKGEAKKESERLAKEGEKLNKDYQDWKKKVEKHFEKVNAHFKKHASELEMTPKEISR